MLTTLLHLIWEFFKTGLFAIGGGLATVPFIYDIAERYDWLDIAVIPDMIAVGESTPGPIGINIATYAGYNAAGVPGAIIATLALITPSIIVIMIVAKFLQKFAQNRFVTGSFYTLRPAVAALIASAAWQVFTASIINLGTFTAAPAFSSFLGMFDLPKLILALCVFLAGTFWKKIHPIVYIVLGAIVGIIFKM